MKIVREQRQLVVTDIEVGMLQEQELAITYTGDTGCVNAQTMDHVVLPVLAASAKLLHALREVEKHDRCLKERYRLPDSLMRVVREAIEAAKPTL